MNYADKDSKATSFTNNSHRTLVKSFSSKDIESVKSQLKSFAEDNCYHIINHKLYNICGDWVLTIEYI